MSVICLDFCMSSFMEVKMCPVNKQVARKKEPQEKDISKNFTISKYGQ